MNKEERVENLLEGVLLVDKPQGRTSFSLIQALRHLTHVQKVGHAGTLDPFATGVMLLLIGRYYTRLSDRLLLQDKEYVALINLGVSTDTYDCDGKVVARSKKKPPLHLIQKVLLNFQGEIEQIPPMYSAKKVEGHKLCDLARRGKTVERKAAKVRLDSTLLWYRYPYLSLRIVCSKGTYIRSVAHELGQLLGCGAHLSELKRTRSGSFTIERCLEGEKLYRKEFDIAPYLLKEDDLSLPSAIALL